MKSSYYMVRPSIIHVVTLDDMRKSSLRYYTVPMKELCLHALADENNKYFGTFIFKWKDGAQWDIVKDDKLIEYERINPSGLRSRSIAAWRTRAAVDRIWMTIRKGL